MLRDAEPAPTDPDATAAAPAGSASGAAPAGLLDTRIEGPLRAGALLGRWRVRREIGSGGQGTVWLAEEEPAGRRVALKVLTPCWPSSRRRRAR